MSWRIVLKKACRKVSDGSDDVTFERTGSDSISHQPGHEDNSGVVGMGEDEAAERLDELVRLFFLGGMTDDGDET
jgi:hypothetical protein